MDTLGSKGLAQLQRQTQVMYRWTEGKDIYENAVGSVILTFHKQAQVHSLQRKGKLDSS